MHSFISFIKNIFAKYRKIWYIIFVKGIMVPRQKVQTIAILKTKCIYSVLITCMKIWQFICRETFIVCDYKCFLFILIIFDLIELHQVRCNNN